MNRSILGRAVFSAVVVLALGFGLQEAVASPAEARRPYCADDWHCEEICQARYGPNSTGYCSEGNTCYCTF
jgi:hypothetical protein